MGLVGRGPELAVLRERLHAAKAGGSGLVLMSGEPGVGKTRLATEASDLARTRGFQVAWAYCRETEGAPAYWPWTQALRAVLRHAPASEPVPEVDELTPLLELSASAPSDFDRFRLFDAVSRLLERMARRRPLLLVFDDLHRADAPSLRLLRFVAAGAGDGLLLLGTYRHTELLAGAAGDGGAGDHPLARLVAEDASSERCTVLPLAGLSFEESGQLLAQLAPGDAGLDVEDVHARTGGNPFFLTEMARVGGRDAVPATLEAAIRARVGQLPAVTAALLPPASVLVRDVAAPLLGRLTDRSAHECAQALQPAVAAGLMTSHPTLGSTYRFAARAGAAGAVRRPAGA